MFDLPHVLYILISGLITAVLLYASTKYVRSENHRNLILKLSAVATVIIHFSSLWVDFFTGGGNAPVEGNHILPIYPCNIIMWMLLILSFMENKKSAVFRLLAEFCFIVGTVCGVIGIVFNINYDSNPSLLDYDILKGLLSHSTMVFGCIYIYLLGYVKFGVFNTLSLLSGFSVFVLSGLAVNGLYEAFGMTPPDGIFLYEVPYIGVSSVPLGALFILVVFGLLALYEQRLPEDERWYSKIKAYFSKAKKEDN